MAKKSFAKANVKSEQFEPKEMVNWYRPRMLLSVAMKAIISGTFGNYADRRELEAALDSNLDSTHEWDELMNRYKADGDFWIDVVNDTGDGFDSTFAIARSVAQSTLKVSCEDGLDQQEVTTKRGNLLVFGGDEVYPFPTRDAYESRFKLPFASAINGVEPEPEKEDRPHLYAIPGNHDWYDGLGNFIKVFCQQREIGIWDTKQHRSYFAIPLRYNFWIWAIDIQLNSDIDAPQLAYFKSIIDRMEENDRVILVTAEPAWVYKEIYRKDISHDRLQFFIDEYIYNKENCTGRNLKLAAVLTGDLHHYARYHCPDNPNGRQYITAGGGGAFLHETHSLPIKLEESKLERAFTFPSIKKSKRLLLGNFLFPVSNRFFSFLIGCLYLFSYWFFGSVEKFAFEKGGEKPFSFKHAFSMFCEMVVFSPGLLIFVLVLSIGYYAFTDTKGRTPWTARSIGCVHAFIQLSLFVIVTYSARFLGEFASDCALWPILISISIIFLGGPVAAFIMGIYLYVSNFFWHMHITEASSSLACPDYKNFLRLKVHENGITIYPIGIKKVPRGWTKQTGSGKKNYSFSGKVIDTFLIEKPIEIHNRKLK